MFNYFTYICNMKNKIIEQQIVELNSQNLSYREISKRLNVSISAISYVLNPGSLEQRKVYSKSKYVPHPKQKIEKSQDEIKHNALIRMLKHRYGLSYKDYQQLYENQKGNCAICKSPLPLGGYKGLYVDHDHETEKVRGLLCSYCNAGLGNFKDSKVFLQNAINYITEHKK